MDLKEMHLLGDSAATQWYYASKSDLVLRMLGDLSGQHVLDVGSGSGYFARQVLRRSGASSVVCVDPGYAGDSDTSEAGKPLLFRRHVERSDAGVCMLMDVLEHVPDDVALLSEHVRMAKPGTRVLITVPAFRWLWSSHDVYLGHYRRYTRGMLTELVQKSGLRLLQEGYFFGAVLPIAAVVRKLERLNPRSIQPHSQIQRHSPPVNGVLRAMCRAELALVGLNRLAGLSVCCVAVKP